ncbi:MAG TPA: tetratricopeptide repeat protein [Pirellulales bacterium]|jgi:Tfp pilus assembly protein PilF|nr:tetratricopeptide repeat protein [Pirellulales bacterium]
MRYRNWSTMVALLALVMWNVPQIGWAHGGGGGGGGGGHGGGGGFGGGGHGGGFGGGHMGGFGGGHMGGMGGHYGGMGGHYGGIGGYSGLGGHYGGSALHSGGIGHSGIGSSGIGSSGIGHSGIGHSGALGSGTLGGAGGLSGIGGHHAAGTVMHNPNSFTTHHLGGHQLSNGAAGNHVISGYRGAGTTFAGTHAQGLLSHQATAGGHHSAFLQHHHVSPTTGTGALGGHGLTSAGTSAMGQHHHGMGGNNFGHNGHHHHHNNFFFPFFGFGFPFFGYGLYGYGYGFGYPYYGYGYGYPYNYGYNPYAYYYGPYGYGYGSYAYPYSYPQTAPTQPNQQAAAGSDAEVFAQKGENDFKAGDYKSAVYAWRHAVLDDPQNGVLTLMLAQGLFATGTFDEAAGAIQQGLQLLPEDQWGVVVSNYRELYGKIGDYTAQLRTLEKAVKQQPDDPGLRFLLGYHYGFLGYPQQAVKQLDKALELAPADQLAQKLRDQLNAKLPKPADAGGKGPDDKEAGVPPNDRRLDNKVTTINAPAR